MDTKDQKILQNESHRLSEYKDFCEKWDIAELVRFVELYDVSMIKEYLPEYPDEKDKQALNQLFGATAESGYMDYQKLNNTNELIMQWREKTNKWDIGPDINFMNSGN